VTAQLDSINLSVDGVSVSVPAGTSVLDACRTAGAHVPTLCHDPRLEPYGGCRLCVVEIEGVAGMPASCTTVATEGMRVTTASDALFAARRTVVELLLSDHAVNCLTCESTGRCGLQDASYQHGIAAERLAGAKHLPAAICDDPLIARDYAKCINCGRCIRICNEVQGCDVYGYTGRGFDALPATPYGLPLLDAGCEFCGQCVSTCPTGALTDRLSRFTARAWDIEWTETTCGYCGVGCTIEYGAKDGRIVGSRAKIGRGVNNGNLCGKGRYGYSFASHPDRLTAPLLRKDGELVEVTWDEAIAAVAENLDRIAADSGPQAIGGLASAKCTNEENYLFQKFMRAVVGTHNIDHCARLCHSSTVSGLVAAFGSGAMTNSIADLGQADVILVIGSNTTEAHPIIGIELKRAARRGTRIYVIDPRRIRLADHAEKWLPVRPGANVTLFNAMARVILDEGLADERFVESRTEGFAEFSAALEGVDVAAAAELAGIEVADLREAAIAYASADAASIVYAMGVTQHTSGTEQVRALANLALLTGQIGRPGTGVNPLRGQNNVQGACDLACLPDCLPGYQAVTDTGSVDRFCDYWETERELPAEAGLTLVEMFDAAVEGSLKALWVVGENPAVSDPDQTHVLEALQALDFLVVSDIFLTETARLADVVLPAACFLEKDGTATNTERRVQRVRRIVDPPAGALTDAQIIARVSKAMGVVLDSDPQSLFAEMAEVTPQYGGITLGRLDREGGVQWPCPTPGHPGTPILHAEEFTRGKGAFAVVSHRPPPELPDAARPIVLSTGRHLWNFHSDTMVRRSAGLGELNAEHYVELAREDAEELGICDGDSVVVESAQGSVATTARICAGNQPRPGTAFMPFHFADAPANRLTGHALDPTSKIPGLKTTPVSVRKA